MPPASWRDGLFWGWGGVFLFFGGAFGIFLGFFAWGGKNVRAAPGCRVKQITFSIKINNTRDIILIALFVLTKATLTSYIMLFISVINVRCSGYVWIEPAPVIQMGLNISINCHSTVNCQMAKLYMILNNSHIEDKLLTTINKTTVQLQLHDFRKPYSTVLCYAKCPSKAANMVVCGTQFSAGHPPDSPTNLTCVIYEHSDHLTCAWDAGKYTYISTNYILYLKSLQTDEEKAFPSTAALNISLSKLQGGKLYSIWVQAKNDLGTAHSDQLQVNLEDLVIPATPVITNVKTTDSSAPRTILHWKKQTSMENIYCEERYKALADQTWHMKEWEVNVTSGPHTEYSLESNTEYEFQVRCRLILAKSYWSGWSAPFIYTTPEAGEFIPRLARGFLHLLLSCITFSRFLKTLNEITPLFGAIVKGSGMVEASSYLITAFASLTPKWLIEDFPNVENSRVVKSLQEKQELMSSNSTQLFLDNDDPVVTEVLETSLQEECKTTDTKKGNRKVATEHMNISQNSLLVSTLVTEQNNGYNPQVSNRSPLGKVFSNTYETQSQALDPNMYLSSQDTHVFLKDYTSPITSLWNAEGNGSNTFLLEKINLILNNNRSGQSNTFSTTDEEPNTLLENQWKSLPSTENVQEQTFLPDELVSCLGAVTEESIGIKSYFPQTVGKLFQ
uniref:Fibronectin type-III domain-containing protein n=2 Tax=Chelydra serpentina TaxID=8475 RepID=A0A8C3RKH7_CHESE